MGAQNVNFAHEFFQNWAISSPELCIIGSKFSDRRKIYQQSEIGMRQTSRFSDSAGSCGRWWMDIRGGPIRNVTLYFCPYLRQLLVDFQNFLLAHSVGPFIYRSPRDNIASAIPLPANYFGARLLCC